MRLTMILAGALLYGTAMASEIQLLDIPNAMVAGNILSGGQPSAEQLAEARDAGFRMVVNLRGEGEFNGYDEAAAARALGLDYRAIPVASAADVNEANARALQAALTEAGDAPVLVHCASGNRVGALVALGAWLDGADPDAAIEAGKRAGLTGLEPHVRSLMDD